MRQEAKWGHARDGLGEQQRLTPGSGWLLEFPTVETWTALQKSRGLLPRRQHKPGRAVRGTEDTMAVASSSLRDKFHEG